MCTISVREVAEKYKTVALQKSIKSRVMSKLSKANDPKYMESGTKAFSIQAGSISIPKGRVSLITKA